MHINRLSSREKRESERKKTPLPHPLPYLPPPPPNSKFMSRKTREKTFCGDLQKIISSFHFTKFALVVRLLRSAKEYAH